MPGIHAPVTSEAMVPSPRPLFHSSDQLVTLVLIRSSSIMRCQYSTAFLVPSSPVRSMETFSPSTLNGVPPAWAIRDMNTVDWLLSPASEVM